MQILFRTSPDDREEYEDAMSVLGDVISQSRTELLPSINEEAGLVVGRYSVLPFYQELVRDLKHHHLELINSFNQHQWIANMLGWVEWLGHLTPTTHMNVGWNNVPDSEHGWVVKGKTNSRKFRWNTHMYAPDRSHLQQVMHNLHQDEMMTEQGLVVREYVPLVTYDHAINGLPITNEWRFFVLDGQILAGDYYWTIADRPFEGGPPQDAVDLVNEVIKEMPPHPICPRFYVVDVGEKAEGGWIVIELNDGQMAGLSYNDPKAFYTNLYERLK